MFNYVKTGGRGPGQDMKLSLIWIFVVFGVFSPVVGQSVNQREGKLLNVFNIVKFPNDGCNATSGSYGVCYTSSECSSLGGSSSGSCASGFGVCCLFSGGCGASTSLNNTYFKSSNSDTAPCTFTVCKVNSDICQIRLGLDEFVIAQPNTDYPGDDEHGGRTQCQEAQFTATSDGPTPPVLCGTNSAHHMIIEARDDCNELKFSWTSTSTTKPSWNIHIMQIACTDQWKPQDGCTQYFTGLTGYIKSYNYEAGYHLANHQYTNCIRNERGYCSISYAQVSTTSFQVGEITPTASPTPGGKLGDSCTTDYIVMLGSAASTEENVNYDRFCGSLIVASSSALTTAATVYTNKLPFAVSVNFDGTELDEDSPAGTEWSKGFYIYYSQSECT